MTRALGPGYPTRINAILHTSEASWIGGASMSEVDAARRKARLATVEEHVKCENRHDLAGVMATFGTEARYDDEPWQDHRLGLDGVRSYYTELLASLPDLAIDVRHRHVATDAIV